MSQAYIFGDRDVHDMHCNTQTHPFRSTVYKRGATLETSMNGYSELKNFIANMLKKNDIVRNNTRNREIYALILKKHQRPIAQRVVVE